MTLKINQNITRKHPPFGTPLYNRGFVQSGGYKYGFNGQEKDNEVSGSGNTNTAAHWEYDTRLGRRWNLDQVIKPNESGYSTFSGNPIVMGDPNGDNADTKLTKNADGKTGTATIKADVYLVKGKNTSDAEFNSYANGYKNRVQGANAYSGNTGNGATFAQGGVTYSVQVEVTVHIAASVQEAEQAIKSTGTTTSSNILTVGKIDPQSTTGGTTSKTYADGRTGFANVGQSSADPHEFAHLLGLQDRYNYFVNDNYGKVTTGAAAAMLPQGYDKDYDKNRSGNLMSLQNSSGVLTNQQYSMIFAHGSSVIPANGQWEKIGGPTTYFYLNMGNGFKPKTLLFGGNQSLSRGSYNPGDQSRLYHKYRFSVDQLYNR